MGNTDSNTTNPSTNSRARPSSRHSDSSQNVNVSQWSPYPGSFPQTQSPSTGGWSRGYPSYTQSTEDNPWNFATSHTANTTSNTAPSGARPKQSCGVALYSSGASYPSSAAYPETSRQDVSSSVTSPINKKPLYMAESFSGLCKGIYRGIDWSNVGRLTWEAQSVMKEANKAYDEKDEEKAYQLYERYAGMWTHIMESEEYKNSPNAFDYILGKTDIQTAYDRTDELEHSLQSRYHTQPVQSSQVTGATPTQTSGLLTNTNSAVEQPQRQTFQPLELQYPSSTITGAKSPGSTTLQPSSNTRNAGLTTSQPTSNTRSTGSTPLQPSNTRSVDSAPSQRPSNTRHVGLTPSQPTGNTRSTGSTPLQPSNTRSVDSAPLQPTGNTRSTGSSTGSTPLQPSNTRSTGLVPSQSTANTGSIGTTPSEPSSNTKSACSTSLYRGRSSESEDRQASGAGTQKQSSAPINDLPAGFVEGMRENLICPVCYELPENVKSLSCGHDTCEKCIRQWVASRRGVLSCPICKTTHPLPLNGVDGLTTNFRLNNLVAELKRIEDEGLDNEGESEEEEQQPIPAAVPSPVETLPPRPVATIPSLLDIAVPQLSSSSGSPSTEKSFLERNNKKSYKDTKGSTIRMRVQLCDSEGNQLRGRRCDKVEATVISPSNEKESVSVTLMKRDGDYSLSFIPPKVGVYLVDAYLNDASIHGSPLRVVVHPSAKFVKIIHNPLVNPRDVVVHGQMIYTTDDSSRAYLSTDWESNWNCPCQDNFDEVDSFGIATAGSRFYVTVTNKSCVYVYDQCGNYLNAFGKRVLESPTGIAVSSTGMIYVADAKINTIDVFRSNFSHLQSIEAGGNANHCSLALLALSPSEDRLIAVDQKQDCFKIFDAVNMKMLKMIKTRVQQAPARPFGVAVDEDGNILVSATFDPSKLGKRGGNNQQNGKRCTGVVNTYNSDGFFLGKFGDNELQNPRGLCILDGEVVVVDEGAGETACLKVYKL